MNDQALKIYLFCCSNSYEQGQLSNYCREFFPNIIKVISLPCSGKVDVPYLVKSFETGADGVMVITCKEDECQHLEGNFRAQKRADAVVTLLEEIGIESCRMTVMTPKTDSDGEIADGIRDFCTKLEKLPKIPA